MWFCPLTAAGFSVLVQMAELLQICCSNPLEGEQTVPELPEVETMVRGIRPHVAGREIAAVRRCRCTCKPLLLYP